jgi:hypothetical protein
VKRKRRESNRLKSMASRISYFSALLLAGGVFLSGGCTVLRTEIGNPIDATLVQDSSDSTHYRDTLKALGPPNRMSTAGSQIVFLYEYVLIKENQIGFSLNIKWLDLFKFTLGKAHAKHQADMFIYGATGQLRSHVVREWMEDLGTGASVQLIVSILNVVDTDDYEVDAYQHMWGAGLLDPQLSVGLNRQNNLDFGAQGLEQLATPTWAGQHTLQQ